MKKHVRTIAVVLLLAAMLLSFAACQSEAAKAADALIQAIGEVDLNSEAAIVAAETAVAALEQKDKDSLKNLEILTQARQTFDEAVDMDKIGKVEALINEIGEVTRESRELINAARTAFDELEPQLRARVANADILTVAEERLTIVMCRISVLGSFYENGKDNSGLLYVVFDYLNDAEDRSMPSNAIEVKLKTTDKTFTAKPNTEHHIYSGGDTYSETDFGYFERYTGYKYAVGAGRIKGNAAPVRMFVCFTVNNADRTNSDAFEFTYDNQIVTIQESDLKDISVIDEIMTVEDDYEKVHEQGQLLWRLDKAHNLTVFINKHWSPRNAPGYNGISSVLLSLFNDQDEGISLNERPEGAIYQNGSTITGFHLVESLPGFNIVNAGMDYPKDAQESLIKYQLALIYLSSEITDSNSSYSRILYLITEVYNQYKDTCDGLGIEEIHDYINYEIGN